MVIDLFYAYVADPAVGGARRAKYETLWAKPGSDEVGLDAKVIFSLYTIKYLYLARNNSLFRGMTSCSGSSYSGSMLGITPGSMKGKARWMIVVSAYKTAVAMTIGGELSYTVTLK